MELFLLTTEDEALIESARKIIEKNYEDKEPYNHTVGAAVRCKDGSVYLGVNCDGVHGSCAEYIAIGAAITDGQREFDTIVASGREKNLVIAPCGNCRQMLLEYCSDTMVILEGPDGNLAKARITDILPLPYRYVPNN